MTLIFPFLSNTDEPNIEDEVSTIETSTANALEINISNMAATQDVALANLLIVLNDFLPSPATPLPASSTSVTSVTERPLGLGNRRGTERLGNFDVLALKGGRLDVLVTFQLWANDPSEVDNAINTLQGALLAASDDLWASGFLRIVAEETGPAEFISGIDAWRKTADFRILYEFHNKDSEGALGLIARIPIDINSDIDSESTLVTNAMARWDKEAASTLSIRGRFQIAQISTLTFIPHGPPSGEIILTRTFEDAIGAPTLFTSLADFLIAVAGPNPIERYAQIKFPSLTEFLAEFTLAGEPITLDYFDEEGQPAGDWDGDGALDTYQTYQLEFVPPIQLLGVADRLELSYQGDNFDNNAVLYAQVKH